MEMELDIHLVKKVSGGKGDGNTPSITDNPGAVAAALAIGATGGPGGLGMAASGLVIAQGINNLNNLAQNTHHEPFMMDLSGNRIRGW